tara:strand:+ start:208 stop:342 length:135 start_codon:yes stop_codon:yes gene_type:complete
MKKKANWELRKIVQALSLMPVLNSKDENKLLKQAKDELIKRRAW